MKTKRLFISTLIAAAAMGLTAYANEAATQTTPVIAETDAPEGADKLLPLADAPAAEDAAAEETQDADALELLLADDALVELDEAAAPDELSTETMMREWIARYAAAARFAGIRSVKGTGGGLSSGGAVATAGDDLTVSAAAPTPSVSVPAAGTVSLADTLTCASAAGVSLGSASASDAGTASVATASSASGTGTILPAAFFSTRSVFSVVPAAAASYSLTGSSGDAAVMTASETTTDRNFESDSTTTLSDNLTTYDNVFVADGVTGTISFGTYNNKNLKVESSVSISTNATLKIQQNVCDLIQLSGLTGSGMLTLSKTDVNAWGGATMLVGDGSGFTGTINVWNGTSVVGSTTNSSYSQGLHLNSATAAKSATIDLGNYTSLVVSAASAEIAGLTGTYANSKVVSYACSWNLDANSSGNPYNEQNPTAFRNNDGTARTLNISGSGDYSFAGTVGVSGANQSSLSLTKSGTGVQTLSGAVYLGDLTVSGGELALSGTTNIAGTARVTDGELDLSGARVTLASAIANSGTVTLSAGTVFNLTSEGEKTLISNGSGGLISGVDWDSLTFANFTYNGAAITGARKVTSSGEGVVTYNADATAKALTWNGADSAVWKTATIAEAADKPWLDGSGTAEAFYSGDSVTFGSATAGRNVALAGVISSGAVAVEDSHTFTFGEGATLTASSMSIADGKTLTLSGTGTIGSAISGAGSVTIAENAEITFSAAASFAGTATVNGTAILAGTTLSALGGGRDNNIAGSGRVQVTVSGSPDMDASRLQGFRGTLVISGSGRFGIARNSGIECRYISDLAGIEVKSGAHLFLSAWSGDPRIGKLSTALTIAGAGYGSGTEAAALRLHEGSTLAGALTLSADATILSSGSSPNTISGGISAFGKTLTLTGTTALNISGTNAVTIGTLRLTKSGTTTISSVVNIGSLTTTSSSGTLVLSRNNAGSFANGINIEAGVLQVEHSNALGSGTLTLGAGATLKSNGAQLNLANAVSAAGAFIVNTQDRAMALSGAITGTGTLTKQGTGTLVLTNNGNAFAGAIVSAGTLVVGDVNAIGDIKGGTDARIFARPETAGNIVVESGAAFKTHLGGGTATNGSSIATVLKTFNGNFYLKNGSTLGNIDGHVKLAGGIVFGATDTAGAYSESSTVELTQYWQKTVELAGVLSGAGMVKLTSPTQEANAFYKISGESNTFSGTYRLENATPASKTTTLVLSTQNAASRASVNLSASGTRLFLGAENVTIAGLEGVSGAVVQRTTESRAPSVSTLTVNQATDTTFEGTFGSGVSLVKAGAGTLTLSNANALSGSLTVSGGVLNLADSAIGGTLTIGENGTLGLTGLNTSTAALTASGAILLSSGAKFDLDRVENGVILLQSDAGINVTGGELSRDNVTLAGSAFGDRTSIGFSNTNGVLAISEVTHNALALTWAGGDSGTWKANGSGWNVTEFGGAQTFQIGDRVEFTSSDAGTVSVEGNVTVDTMKVSSGTHTFSAASGGGKIFSTGAVSVESGATMNLNGDVLGKLGEGLVVKSGGALNVNAAVTTPSALSVETGGEAAFSASGTFATISVGGNLSTTAALTSTGALSVNGALTSSAAVSATQLSGSGTIDLGSAGTLTLSNSTKFNNWTGTVKLSDRGTNNGSNITLGNYGTTGSSVELAGYLGYFADSTTISVNLVLKNSSTEGRNYAVNLMNGSSTGTITFSGSVSGDGTFQHDYKTGTTNVTQSYKFTGDLSGFSGTFQTVGNASAGDLIFGDGGNGVTGTTEGGILKSVSGTGTINWKSGKTEALGVVYNYANDVFATNTFEGASTKIVKQGAGSLTLTGTNSYAGGTTIENGTLVAANASALGSGPVTAAGSVGVNEVTLRVAQDGSGNALTIENNISVSEGKTLILESANVDNKLTGSITGTSGALKLASGTLEIAGTSSLKLVKVGDGAVLKFSGETTSIVDTTDGALVDGGGKLVFSSGTATVSRILLNTWYGDSSRNPIPSTASALAEVSGGVVNVTSNSQDGAISIGSGASTHSHTLTISGGVLNATARTTTLGYSSAGTLAVTGGEANLKGIVFGLSGANSDGTLQVSGGRLNVGESGITSGGGSGTKTISFSDATIGALDSWNSAAGLGISLAGAVTFDTTKRVASDSGADTAGTTITLAGALSGSGTLTKVGAGTLKLTGDNSAFTGNVKLSAGTLEIGHSNALGSSTSTLNVTGDSELKLGSGLNVTNSIIFMAENAVTLTVNAAVDTEFSGAFIPIDNSNIVRKVGAGTLTLSGNNEWFSRGTISVEEGTVLAAQANALGKGKVTVGADGKLGIAAGVTITEVSGGIELANGAKIVVDLSDRLSETATFEVTLATNTAISLAAEAALAYSEGGAMDLTDYLELKGWNKSGWTSSLTYANETLTLTMAIPEPSLFGLLAGVTALGFSMSSRRRRKKA